MSNYKYDRVMKRVRSLVGVDSRFEGMALEYHVTLKVNPDARDCAVAILDLSDLSQCDLDGRLDERIGVTLDALANQVHLLKTLENDRAKKEKNT